MELKRWRLRYVLVHLLLLIVPYGIETEEINNGVTVTVTFNRTLWN